MVAVSGMCRDWITLAKDRRLRGIGSRFAI
jgi:hypothetical protein